MPDIETDLLTYKFKIFMELERPKVTLATL